MKSKGAWIGLSVVVLLLAAAVVRAVPSAMPARAGRSAAAESPWPMFGHDARHTGRSPYVGPAWPRLKWRYQISCCREVKSSPVIGADGTVYIGSYDGSLYALRPDGTLRWKYVAWSRIYVAAAVASDGTIYVGMIDAGEIDAIQADGTFRWRFGTGAPIEVPPTVGANGS